MRIRAAIGSFVVVAVGCGLTVDFDRYSANHGKPADAFVSDIGVNPEVAPIVEEDVSLPDVAPIDTYLDTYAPPSDTGVACPSGQLRCGDTCRDIKNDRNFCGDTCASCEAQGFKGASRCVAGKCECASGATKCGGDTCTFTDSDPVNCGGCGTKVHDSSQTCSASKSVCAWSLRPCLDWSFAWGTGRIYVDCPTSSECVDTSSEGNFCFEYYSSGNIKTYRRCYDPPPTGWCINNACKYASSSEPNPCTSLPDRIECTVVTSPTDSLKRVRSCVNKLRDPNHCGACNNKCAAADELCAAGACKKYRPAKSEADCGAGWKFCAPPGYPGSVCIFTDTCP